MSRKIDDTKAYSADDEAYLHERSLDWKIEENRRRFGKRSGGNDPVALLSDDVPGVVADNTDDAVINDASESAAEYDLSGFNPDLVQQVEALDGDALKEECNLRGVVADGPPEKQRYELLKKVTAQVGAK